jgi:glycosyltransferase involved in cell wall biosynthesis
MRILHLLAPARVGGLEKVVAGLAMGTQTSGDAVALGLIIEPGTDGPRWAQTLAAQHVYVHEIRVGTRDYRAERHSVARLCTSWQPDVVHTHGYRADVVDAPVARRQRLGIVSTVHGTTKYGLRNHVYEWLQRRAWRRFDAVVAVSRPLIRYVETAGVLRQRIHYVPNAWQTVAEPLGRDAARRLLDVPPDGFRIGWVGRTSREKGLDVFVDALAHLREVPVVASICGVGPELRAMQARARILGVHDRCSWHGEVIDAARLLRAFNVIVLSSRMEGTPMVLLEAMAAGVPIVATAVGGVPDVVTPDEAHIVEPESPRALAAAIRHVLENPRSAAMRTERAMARLAEHYDAGRWISAYRAVYRSAMIPHFAASPTEPIGTWLQERAC